MKKFLASLLVVFAMIVCGSAIQTQAQVVVLPQVVIGVGVEPPVCEWGYYDYEPYDCAPYGFYGPEFFYGGLFIGVGPWENWGYSHGWGGHRFHGNRYGYRHDPRYHGHGGRKGGHSGHGGGRAGHSGGGHGGHHR